MARCLPIPGQYSLAPILSCTTLFHVSSSILSPGLRPLGCPQFPIKNLQVALIQSSINGINIHQCNNFFSDTLDIFYLV